MFLLLLSRSAGAQADSTADARLYTPSGYLLSFGEDIIDLAIAPSEWDSREWAACGLTVASILYLMTIDQDLQVFFADQRSPATDRISKYLLEPWGNYYSLGTLGLFYAGGWISQDAYSRETALLGLKSFVLGGLAARIPKMLGGRHRPYQDDPPDPWNWEGPGLKYHSFVSGHTTAAFAVAATLSVRYPEKRWVGWVSYAVAGLTALSRLNDNRHWGSDVLAGAVLGYAIGTRVGRKGKGADHPGIYLTPGGAGLALSF